MKKLTALLLGTVISIAFTADAFADPLAIAKKYWNSNDGKTGSYLGLTYDHASIDDITARNYNADDSKSSLWKLDDGKGGKLQIGYDFGKIRFDWRLAALYSNVDTVDNAAPEFNKSDDALLGYSTFNLGLDLFRFELIKRGFVDIAITPYVGAGAGYGGGWMTFKKNSDPLAGTVGDKRDAGGHGFVYTGEAGVLFNLMDWVGVTLGYSYLDMTLAGHTNRRVGVQSDLWDVGVRFTY